MPKMGKSVLYIILQILGTPCLWPTFLHPSIEFLAKTFNINMSVMSVKDGLLGLLKINDAKIKLFSRWLKVILIAL